MPPHLEEESTLPKTMVFFDDILESMRARQWVLKHLPKRLQDRVKTYNARRSKLGRALVLRDFRNGAVDTEGA